MRTRAVAVCVGCASFLGTPPAVAASPGLTSTALSATRAAAPVVGHRRELSVPNAVADHLALFGRHWLAYATGSSQARTTDLELVNLATGVRRVVARSQWPRHGVLDWVEGTGNFVSWTDEASIPSDGDPYVRWTLHAEDLLTGHRFLIARSAPGHPSPTPIPRAGDGYLTWGKVVGQHLALYAERLSTQRRTRVVRSATYLTDSGVTRGWLVYDTGRRSRLMEAPLTGGQDRELPRAERAANPRADCGNVVWELHSQAGDYGDPVALYESPVRQPRPLRVIHGANAGNAVVGADFIAYWDYHVNVRLAGLTHDAASQVIGSSADVPARMTATCHRLAFAVDQRANRSPTDPLGPPPKPKVFIEVVTIK